MDTTMTDEMSRLSLSDLFNAQAAQQTLQRLVDVINTQAAAVERLMKRVATLETTQRHAVSAQQLSLQQLDATVVQLERLQDNQAAMEARQRADMDHVDSMMAATEARLARECEERSMQLKNELKDTEKRVRQELASMEFATRLQEDLFAVHDRVAALEIRVDRKLDKSEMTRLESVVAKINSFAPTATQLSARVSSLEESLLEAQRRGEREAQKTLLLSDQLSRLEAAVQGKVDIEVWEEFVKKEVTTKVNQLRHDSEATQSLVGELVHRGVALETSHRTLASKLTSVATAMADELNSFRVTIQADLGRRPDRDEVESAMTEVRHELNCKAWRKDTETIKEELAELKIHVEDMERHVELSTRFLNWFSKRGEAYERNLDIVEHQLERIAHASAPQLRQPFDDQVRFHH